MTRKNERGRLTRNPARIRPSPFRLAAAFFAFAAVAWAGAASAQVISVDSLAVPAVIGRTMTANVDLQWTRITGAAATIATPMPAQLAAGTLPGNCSGTATILCTVPAGGPGATGTITFQVVGLAVGGFNLTATSGSSSATNSGVVALSGDLTIAKNKFSPSGNPVAGAAVTFRLVPNIAAGGDDIDASGSIVISDNLPTNATDYALTNISAPAGVSCNAVGAANASRNITCTVTGPLSRANFNLIAIDITGTVGTQGNFSNGAAITSGNNNYVDRDPNNNTANAPYTVTQGVDAQAQGSFPSSPVLVNTPQTLTITYRNNGPGASPAGGTVSTAIPAGFVIGALPSGCVNNGSGTVNGVAGTVIVCTTTSPVSQGAVASFALPLTAPLVPTSGNFPVEVAPPPGYGDANPGNNDILLPYQVVNPYADLSLGKTKSPSPVGLGAPITSTITVANNGIAPATYGATGALTALAVTEDLANDELYVSASAGWTCADNPGIPDPAHHRVVCEQTVAGTLGVGSTLSLTLTTTTVAVGNPGALAGPTSLANTACTGRTALLNLGRDPVNAGPQPADASSGNDCANASVIATPFGANAGNPIEASIVKESSRDGSNWVDATGQVPNNTVGAADSSGYWRMTVTTPNVAGNPFQLNIPTLVVTDNLPGLLNVASPGAPAPSQVTPAIPITVTVNGVPSASACPATVAASGGTLACSISNVAPGTTIVITAAMSRPFASGTLTNTAAISSPDTIIVATPGGQLTDSAALYVAPRVDVAMTQKSLNPPNSATLPRIGQTLQFTLAAENFGPDPVAGAMTISDTYNPAIYTVLSATGTNMDCTGSNFAAGLVSCASTTTVNRYDVRTVLVTVRITSTIPASCPGGICYADERNTAVVSIDPLQNCEWKTETATLAGVSGACNDGSNGTTAGAAASSANTPAYYPASDGSGSRGNNRLTIPYQIKVPQIDLQQRKEFALPLPNGQASYSLDQPLIYRFRLQNNGPSRANSVTMNDILSVPAGFTLALPASPYNPVNVNNVAAQSSYALDSAKTSATVSCTQTAPNADVACVLNTIPASNFLDAGSEVNFEIPFVIGNPAVPAIIPVQFGDTAYVCGDETVTYESSGACSSNQALAGNNLARVNNVVFPKTDLQVVSKTATPASGALVNQPIRYDIVVRNNGSSATAKMIVRDPLPVGFEWMTGVDGLSVNRNPTAVASAATNGLAVNAVAVVGSAPAAGTDNVCFVASGPASITASGQQQTIQCNLGGVFPASMGTDGTTVTLTLWARPKVPFFNGPFGSNLGNTATIQPGVDGNGDPVSFDANANNNAGSANTQVVTPASIAGRTFLDRNANGLQDGAAAAQDSGIAPTGTGSAGTWSVTLTGTDLYGNALNITLSSAQIDATNAGAGSPRGSYLFGNLPPSNGSGYTITQQQPAGYGNGTPSGSPSGTASAGTFSNTANTSSTYTGVVLNAAQNGVNFNFPETQLLLLSGFVYLDGNDNGVFTPGLNGDLPLPNVVLTITGYGFGPNGVDDGGPGASGSDDIAVANLPGMGSTTAVTDSNGFYQFALPQSGRYTVTEQATQPFVTVPVLGAQQTVRGITTAGTITGSGTPGSVPGVSGTAGTVLDEFNGTLLGPANRQSVIQSVVLQSGASSPNNNFGEVLLSSIAGVVYTEKGTPASNYQPGPDWPFPGVTVTLTGTDDLGRPVSLTVITDPSGAYVFTGLRPGNYTVTKQNPPGIVSETAPGGAFPGLDQNSAVKGARSTSEIVNNIAIGGGGTQVTKVNFAVTNGPPPLVPIPALSPHALLLLMLGLAGLGWHYRRRGARF